MFRRCRLQAIYLNCCTNWLWWDQSVIWLFSYCDWSQSVAKTSSNVFNLELLPGRVSKHGCLIKLALTAVNEQHKHPLHLHHVHMWRTKGRILCRVCNCKGCILSTWGTNLGWWPKVCACANVLAAWFQTAECNHDVHAGETWKQRCRWHSECGMMPHSFQVRSEVSG